MIVAPSRMKIPRRTSAMMMPTISTSCWYFRGTAKRVMITMNTNRLSMLRLYSVIQPATNCVPCSAPAKANIRAPKTRARAT